MRMQIYFTNGTSVGTSLCLVLSPPCRNANMLVRGLETLDGAKGSGAGANHQIQYVFSRESQWIESIGSA